MKIINPLYDLAFKHLMQFEDTSKYLKAPLMDEAFRRRFEAEDQIDRAFKQKEEEILQSEKQKEEAEKREKEALNKITSAVQKLHQKGFTHEEIAEDFALTPQEVKKILND